MKFKSLFLGMLGAGMFLACNNENVVNPENINPGVDPTGETTHASFALKFTAPTYAHTGVEGTTDENAVFDAALFVYKLNGDPEAMIWANSTQFTDVPGNTGGTSSPNTAGKLTVKCKSGEKWIYVAVNPGATTTTPRTSNLVNFSYAGTDHTSTAQWVGVDWELPTSNPRTYVQLNKTIVSGGVSTLATDLGSATISGTNSLIADGLIKALTNKGNAAATGGFNGQTNGEGYFMSNWGDATYQNTDAASDISYRSTVKFTLKPFISGTTSRNSASNADSNAFVVNVQRAIAKIQVQPISTSVQNNAGGGSSKGVFTPVAKWAVGNINTSEYPFQLFESNGTVKSTVYDSIGSLAVGGLPFQNLNWVKNMDNSRWIPQGKTYVGQALTSSEVLTTLTTNTKNMSFGTTNAERALVTENNNKNTYNHYSTFVVIGGEYVPREYVSSVDAMGPSINKSSGRPSYAQSPSSATNYPGITQDLDTLYFVRTIGDSGTFFHGLRALRRYIGYVIQTVPPTIDADTVTAVRTYLNNLRQANGSSQASLQAYHKGNCFYRIWVRDADGSTAANKILARRNHVYDITIKNILGPGIGDPNDIIDPDPKEPEPIEEADTYVSVQIQIMKWHIVSQDNELKID